MQFSDTYEILEPKPIERWLLVTDKIYEETNKNLLNKTAKQSYFSQICKI